jgi:hypothetical protein
MISVFACQPRSGARSARRLLPLALAVVLFCSPARCRGPTCEISEPWAMARPTTPKRPPGDPRLGRAGVLSPRPVPNQRDHRDPAGRDRSGQPRRSGRNRDGRDDRAGARFPVSGHAPRHVGAGHGQRRGLDARADADRSRTSRSWGLIPKPTASSFSTPAARGARRADPPRPARHRPARAQPELHPGRQPPVRLLRVGAAAGPSRPAPGDRPGQPHQLLPTGRHPDRRQRHPEPADHGQRHRIQLRPAGRAVGRHLDRLNAKAAFARARSPATPSSRCPPPAARTSAGSETPGTADKVGLWSITGNHISNQTSTSTSPTGEGSPSRATRSSADSTGISCLRTAATSCSRPIRSTTIRTTARRRATASRSSAAAECSSRPSRSRPPGPRKAAGERSRSSSLAK